MNCHICSWYTATQEEMAKHKKRGHGIDPARGQANRIVIYRTLVCMNRAKMKLEVSRFEEAAGWLQDAAWELSQWQEATAA